MTVKTMKIGKGEMKWRKNDLKDVVNYECFPRNHERPASSVNGFARLRFRRCCCCCCCCSLSPQRCCCCFPSGSFSVFSLDYRWRFSNFFFSSSSSSLLSLLSFCFSRFLASCLDSSNFSLNDLRVRFDRWRGGGGCCCFPRWPPRRPTKKRRERG